MMHVVVGRNIKPDRAGRELPEGLNLTDEGLPLDYTTVLCSDEPWNIEGDCRAAWLGYYGRRDGWTSGDDKEVTAPLYWKAI